LSDGDEVRDSSARVVFVEKSYLVNETYCGRLRRIPACSDERLVALDVAVEAADIILNAGCYSSDCDCVARSRFSEAWLLSGCVASGQRPADG